MAERSTTRKSKTQRKQMTLEEIRAFNAKLMADPKIQSMIRDADDPANANDVVRWEDSRST